MRFRIEFTLHPKHCSWEKANRIIMNIFELLQVDNLMFKRIED